MKTVKNPDYHKAEHLAYKILSNFPYPTIPINVFAIASFYKNLRIKSYSWFAQLNRISISEVIDFAQSESGCCYYNVAQKTYLILYNDTITSTGHIRWTLGHEFGHFLLKHNEYSKDAIISRNSMLNSQYETYEKEANCFARSLLAPPNLISALNLRDYNDIADVFNLSPTAALNILSFISNSNLMGIYYLKKCELTQNFTSVIWRFSNLKCCSICGHEYSRKYTYCPICRSTAYKYAGDEYMIYQGVLLDENKKAQLCPVCKNEEHLSGAIHCMICGKSIVNHCTFAISENVPDYIEQCNHVEPLPGNARYCPYCGSETTFLREGLLLKWDQDPQESASLFLSKLADDDGNLPF